jgi:hypothetical protein
MEPLTIGAGLLAGLIARRVRIALLDPAPAVVSTVAARLRAARPEIYALHERDAVFWAVYLAGACFAALLVALARRLAAPDSTFKADIVDDARVELTDAKRFEPELEPRLGARRSVALPFVRDKAALRTWADDCLGRALRRPHNSSACVVVNA